MASSLNTTTEKILKMASKDRRICRKAKEMLIYYAEALKSGGSRDIYDLAYLAYDFADAPPTYSQILDQWDGPDPANGLARHETILHAMKARIVECNLEKLLGAARSSNGRGNDI